MNMEFLGLTYFQVDKELLGRKILWSYHNTFPKATVGENGAPALFGVEGLLRGGLYPGTQLGENLGLAVAGREGLKLSTLCPCRGDDWAGAGVSFFSGFSVGGEA